MCNIRPYSPTSIQSYKQLADRGRSLDSNNTCHISYAVQCRELIPCCLSTCFEPLYTNMYHVGLSDATVSCYTLRLKICGATMYTVILFCNLLHFRIRMSAFAIFQLENVRLHRTKNTMSFLAKFFLEPICKWLPQFEAFGLFPVNLSLKYCL